MGYCAVVGCNSSESKKGLCLHHYNQKRHKSDPNLRKWQRGNKNKVCEVDNCNNPVWSIMLCSKHYQLFHRWSKEGKTSSFSDFLIKVWSNQSK